jgi:hypothetical protein
VRAGVDWGWSAMLEVGDGSVLGDSSEMDWWWEV